MTRIPATLIFGLTSAAFLSACAATGPIYSTFRSEAGALKDSEAFGIATATNTAVMTRELRFTIDLAEKFASEVPDQVNFDFNSSRLDAAAKEILRRQADWIVQFPEIEFRVFGHTDLVGDEAANQSLGMRRARAVVDYLVSMGVDRSRLEAVISHGETQPLIQTENRERRNRRTVTEVSGFVAGHPTVLNGKYAAIVYRDYVKSAQIPSTLSEAGSLAGASQ